MLAAFCVERGIGDDIRKVDQWVVADFIAFLENEKGLASRTSKKYVSRLKLYFEYAQSRRYITDNPWEKAKVHMPTSKNNEKERHFTETEVFRLLTGGCKQALLDAMMISGLTGARLDAVVDLRADDIIEGKCFRFKPQKREPGVRFVPIHPNLRETVTRLLGGKTGTDSLFPEYPIPENPNRERSFAASKQFTTYRRSMRIDEVLPGQAAIARQFPFMAALVHYQKRSCRNTWTHDCSHRRSHSPGYDAWSLFRRPSVRRQIIWLRLDRGLAECVASLWVDIKRRVCGATSVDAGWSGV